MEKIIILSEQRSFYKRPISHDAILGQESEFLKHGKGRVEVRYKSFFLKAVNKIISRFGMPQIKESFCRKKYDDGIFLYIAMHLNYLKSNLYLLEELKKNGNRIALYVWDCWEPEFDDWQKVLDELNPDHIFFSFRQTYEHFKDRYDCSWIPQSANLLSFKNLNSRKSRMLLQMGRVNSEIHKRIISYMNDHHLEDIRDNYAYRRDDKEVLFPDLKELVEEINRSKYIVCIPKCYENPKRTGNISAMTGRYYEAIVCKTMIIGKKPLVFDELFGKDGMIEFNDDFSDFDEKIDEMENDPERYNEITQKNYECFMNNHTWSHRLDQMFDVIDNIEGGNHE